MPKYSPHQGTFRIGQKRVTFYSKRGLFGSTFATNPEFTGPTADSERALKKKLEAQGKAPKKKTGWFG